MKEKNYTERALSRISPVYEHSSFIREIFNAASDYYEKIRECFETLREQRYIDTVSWGIKYQEQKYSLPIREDLDLEARRAELGIRARAHLPLNPAILEESIRKNYGMEAHLSEERAGYIEVITGATTENYPQMISWLLNEKPAHLLLESKITITEYTGGGGVVPDILYPDPPPIPKGSAQKKYPRNFFATAQFYAGNVTIDISKPSDESFQMKASVVSIVIGEITMGAS